MKTSYFEMRFALRVYLFLEKLHFFHNIIYPGNPRLISLPTVCSLVNTWGFFQFKQNCYEKKIEILMEHSIYKNELKVTIFIPALALVISRYEHICKQKTDYLTYI